MRIDEMKKFVKDIDSGKVRTLKLQDKFQFKCTACGKCCFNNDVIVNIYDLVRLRNAVKLQTQEILKGNFVNFYLGPTSGLPILTINFQKLGEKVTRCPFLAPAIHFNEVIKKLKIKTKREGKKFMEEYRKNPRKLYKDLDGVKIERWLCAVHKHRPMICRLFPLGRIKRLDKKLKLEKEVFIIQNKVNWCPGWKEKYEYTLKSFLDECEFWHYKEGSDKSHAIMNLIMKSGFFALTKDNKTNKVKPLFKTDSPVLKFIGNLIYNFDSINYFSKDKRIVGTIYKDVSHKDFMYVIEKVEKIVDYFIQAYTKRNLESFMSLISKLT